MIFGTEAFADLPIQKGGQIRYHLVLRGFAGHLYTAAINHCLHFADYLFDRIL